MQSKSNAPAFNSVWHDKDQGYRRKNYVPLSERKDWDGEVEKLPPLKKEKTTPIGSAKRKP